MRMFAFAYPSLCYDYITVSNTHSISAVLSSNGQQFETAIPSMRVLACETSLKFRHFNVNYPEFYQFYFGPMQYYVKCFNLDGPPYVACPLLYNRMNTNNSIYRV